VFDIAAFSATIRGSSSPLYIVVAYMLFPIAELCLVPISLSFITKIAPKGMDTMMVGVWMFASAIASYLTG